MKIKYNKEHQITYTEADEKLKLSLTGGIQLVQDMMTEYFATFESDNLTLRKRNNAAWVVTKTKMHFNKHPEWRDKIKGECYTTKTKPVRVEIETNFKDNKGNLLFCAKQETCVIDLNTRKVKKISDVSYPKDMEIEESLLEEPFFKLNTHFSEKDKVYERTVYSSDIDYSGHVNNAMYVTYIINCLSCEFLYNHEITDFEIHYISEGREGQIFEVYKKERENEIEFFIKESDREVLRAILKYI